MFTGSKKRVLNSHL